MKKSLIRIVFFLFFLVLISFSILFIRVFCPFGPESSSTFDCDDAILLMYHHFRNWGFEVTIVAGNLKLNGETFKECNHIWLMVQLGNNLLIPREWLVPYDWVIYYGEPRFFDAQHHEYYPITYDLRLKAVEADK